MIIFIVSLYFGLCKLMCEVILPSLNSADKARLVPTEN